jgi:hypothetical protein
MLSPNIFDAKFVKSTLMIGKDEYLNESEALP